MKTAEQIGITQSHYEAFLSLIERYKTITLEEITAAQVTIYGRTYTGHRTKELLTGYGNYRTCTICRSINVCGYKSCVDYGCIFTKLIETKETACTLDATYDAIYDAETPAQLLTAYRNSAKYLEELISENTLPVTE